MDNFNPVARHELVGGGVAGNFGAGDFLQVEDEHGKFAVGDDAAVELAERTGGAVSGIGENFQAEFFLALVHGVERIFRHVDFTANFHVRRRV